MVDIVYSNIIATCLIALFGNVPILRLTQQGFSDITCAGLTSFPNLHS